MLLTSRRFCGKIVGDRKGARGLTPDELQFFSGHGEALPLYVRLRERVLGLWPDTGIRVARTQITFTARYGFALVSTRRMGRRCGDVFIIVSFGLSHELRSPRILAASEPYPGRWTHHVVVSRPEEIDGELMGWLAEARGFALSK